MSPPHRLPLLVVGLLGLCAPAVAQEEACPADANVAQLREQIDTATRALTEANLASARPALSRAQFLFVCVPEPADSADLAQFARQMAFLYFYKQDEFSATSWGLLSRYADRKLPWPADILPTHPFRELLEQVEDTPMGGPAALGLLPPKGGGIFLDGRLITEPRANAEVPHLVQVFDKKGALVKAYWQEGAVFSGDLLSSETTPPKPPKWYDAATGSSQVAGTTAKPDKPDKPAKPPKTPRTGGGGPSWAAIGAGGGLVVVSGVLYGLGAAQHGKLADADSPEDLTRTRSSANMFVVGSGVAAAAAAGAVGAGILLGDTNGVVLNVRF